MNSMRAIATRTGARPRPATQWQATQGGVQDKPVGVWIVGVVLVCDVTPCDAALTADDDDAVVAAAAAVVWHAPAPPALLLTLS